MKNCLIVVVVLFGCFVAAAILEFGLNTNWGRGGPGGLSLEIAGWRNFDDPDLSGTKVDIMPNELFLQIPPDKTLPKSYIVEKGEWRSHVFYCDSHLDAPAEVAVATEQKNEDLELDMAHFFPGHSGKITCVKVIRGLKDDHWSPYPVAIPGETVSYPPPRGLIQVGMLECDLRKLPWKADKIESTPLVVHAATDTLSDGRVNHGYFPPFDDGTQSSQIYNYHSDRSDAPKLLVTVYQGRVVQVDGGAEETADLPYHFPSPPLRETAEESKKDRGWVQWLFDQIFGK